MRRSESGFADFPQVFIWPKPIPAGRCPGPRRDTRGAGKPRKWRRVGAALRQADDSLADVCFAPNSGAKAQKRTFVYFGLVPKGDICSAANSMAYSIASAVACNVRGNVNPRSFAVLR